MKLDAVLERVAAVDTTADHGDVRRLVLETIAALGLEVARDGEVYNPAAPERPRWQMPEQRNVTFAGMSSRRRRRS
jgi:hypothetical protein